MQRRASLIMLPRIGSMSDCNFYWEKNCKTFKNLAVFIGNLLI